MAFEYDNESKFSKAGKSLHESTKPKMRDPFQVPAGVEINPRIIPQEVPEDPLLALGGKEPEKKDARKSVISNFRATGHAPEISDKQAKKVEYILSDPSKMQERLDKDSGVSGAFAQALLGFLPTIAGAIFGGDEGGAAGAQIGLKAMGAYGDTLNKQQDAAVEQQKIAQIANIAAEKLKSDEMRDIYGQSSQDERLKLQLQSQEKMAREEMRAKESSAVAAAFQSGAAAQEASKLKNYEYFREDLKNSRMSKTFIDTAQMSGSYNQLKELLVAPSFSAKPNIFYHTYTKFMDPNSAVLPQDLENTKSAASSRARLVRDGKLDSQTFNLIESAITGDSKAQQAALQEMMVLADYKMKGQKRNVRTDLVRVIKSAYDNGVPLDRAEGDIGEDTLNEYGITRREYGADQKYNEYQALLAKEARGK